ncbi:helix-turn-helix domain-containing protein [Kutzneria chonburiensis]|uniref:Helix-turn-helix domain-containing protein n=1 Tax=Kutzneria chonburiensis TaxID=1483604 RepID=A0ABV6N534_9PSEU|nr:helix-turn-helix transcriptional regulator [Kutzneria chonburiensis]
MANPVVSKILLGFEMRELRENSSVSREAMAEVLDCDLSKISRIENDKGSLTSLEVKALAELFDLPAKKAERLKALAKDSRHRASYRVADWAQKFTGIEQASSEIRSYENELVPGLFQTEDYTRAITRAADPTRPARDVDRLVAGRAERQAVLTQEAPPRIVSVINEAVVRRVVGGSTVMGDQLTRLREIAELPTVELHVLPFIAGAHAAMGSSFVLLQLPDPYDVRIVYLESLTSADYLDQEEQVDACSLTFERLLGAALSTAQTVGLIDQVMREL